MLMCVTCSLVKLVALGEVRLCLHFRESGHCAFKRKPLVVILLHRVSCSEKVHLLRARLGGVEEEVWRRGGCADQLDMVFVQRINQGDEAPRFVDAGASVENRDVGEEDGVEVTRNRNVVGSPQWE